MAMSYGGRRTGAIEDKEEKSKTRPSLPSTQQSMAEQPTLHNRVRAAPFDCSALLTPEVPAPWPMLNAGDSRSRPPTRASTEQQ